MALKCTAHSAGICHRLQFQAPRLELRTRAVPALARSATPTPSVCPTRLSGRPHRRLCSQKAVEVLGAWADGAELATAAGAGSVFAAGLFLSLWILERQAKAAADSEVTLAQGHVAERDIQLRTVQAELEVERKGRGELAIAKKHLVEFGKDQLKLERALETRDAQLESFMTIAQRQIALLEERVRELQKMD